MNDNILKAVEILNKGGIIIFPTDTAFGIGCRIDREESIKKLFKIRKRPINMATPVLVSSVEMAGEYFLSIPKDVRRKLIDIYWPGTLTIVFPCKKEKVPSLVRGGKENIGIRMPDNRIVLEIIEKLGVPILGPSANIHNEQTPYSFEDLDKKLVQQVDYVMKGEVKYNNSSTVIDCSVSPWKILRPGDLSIKI